MRYFIGLLLALTSSIALAQDTKAPVEVDTAEVNRRGDDVSVVGEGPRDSEDEALRAALAPPADDGGKWFVTVISIKDCAPCAKLKADFRKAPELLAFVAAPEETKAWAHYNEYLADDTLQQKIRLKDYKLAGYPTVIVQPPRNGSWGDPGVVVFQGPHLKNGKHGYEGPAALADQMRAAIKAFSAKMRAKGYPKEPSQQAELSESQESFLIASPGADESLIGQAGVDPPFPPYSPPLPPDPMFPAEYPPRQVVVPEQAVTVGGMVLVTILTALGLTGFAGLIFAIWTLLRSIAVKAGKQPLLTEEQFQRLKSDVLSALGQNPNPPSPPVNR